MVDGGPPHKTFVVFVFFVVKSPFNGPGEGKGFVYHEDHEDHEEGKGVWGAGLGEAVPESEVS